jgi:hypothetical protein
VRIGFISGDIVEVDNTRAGVSVPDYPVQGFLMQKLIERGHEVVLFTRYPKGAELPSGVQDAVGSLPQEHGLDVLFGDRLGYLGSEWEVTLSQLESYKGKVVYHQYVPYSGWAPPFREKPWLLSHDRDWLVLNRADDPKKAYHAMAGHGERVVDNGTVAFKTWCPFVMLEYPWRWSLPDTEVAAQPRQYAQGYFGRIPKTERRAKRVLRWMDHDEWSRVVYGPETSTKWVSDATGCVNGGRVLHKDLPKALETFNVTVQVAIDRLRNRGSLNYVPHRVVECALAGVVQFFDSEMGLPGLEEWVITGIQDMERVAEAVRWEVVRREIIEEQRRLILPKADPTRVIDNLDKLLVDFAHERA